MAGQYSILTFFTHNDLEFGQMDKLIHGFQRLNGVNRSTVFMNAPNFTTTTYTFKNIDCLIETIYLVLLNALFLPSPP